MKRILFVASVFLLSCVDLSTEGKFFKGMPYPSNTDGGSTPSDGGIVCECQLPPPTCDGNKRVQAISARCLDNGGCAFRTTETECPNGCMNAACNGDQCLGVTCNLPPPATCTSATTLRIFSSQGVCALGNCQYASADVSCTCSNGKCETNKCAGQTCTTPPADACLVDGHSLRTYQPRGSCNPSTGNCNYAETIVDCGSAGCSNSVCNADMCLGVSCTNPPSPACMDEMTLRTYAPKGVCHSQGGQGICVYAASDKTCGPGGCVNGACQEDKCINVVCQTPPNPTCASLNTVAGWSASGTCDPADGSCSYQQQNFQCPKGNTCIDGQCVQTTTMCNSMNCKGCCNGNQCISFLGQSKQQCGKGGEACMSCGGMGRCLLGECKGGN